MSALISDVLDGSVSPVVCNAAVNAGGKMLKSVEMQFKYGTPTQRGRTLTLVAEPTPTPELAPPLTGKARVRELELELARVKRAA